MRIASVLLVGNVNWRISETTPATSEIEPGWEVVNPLVPIGMEPESMQLLPLDDGAFFVRSSMLNLVVPAPVNTGEVMVRAERALRFLRVATRNPNSPGEIAGVGISTIRELPGVKRPTVPAVLRSGRVSFLWNRDRTTATLDQVVDAFRESGEEPPVYATLALDAVAARGHDYKKCILFAAFAIETLAATLLDEEYERVRGEQDPAPTWHFITRTISGNQTVRKDPIFEALRAQANNNAKFLLHELPLYVFGRSLLQDDEVLYRQAEELRRSRNAVAHDVRGDAQGRLPLDLSGATQAVHIAKDVFRWFGATDFFLEVGGNSHPPFKPSL